jgi:tripartite-type tricarboxylate transporter receptor subunit TctC
MLKRRTFVASSIVAGLAAPAALRAQTLKQEVRFLNGFPPGGTSDLLGRLLAQALEPVVGQKVIVEQKTGASGFIAAEACARAPADGHTIFLAPMAVLSIAPVMPGQKLPIDVDKELTPIGNVAGVYNMLVAKKDNGKFTNVPELIAYAKANPGKLSYASAGNGTSQHLSAELFKKLAAVDILHVPYRGGAPAVLDIIAGRCDMMFGNMPEFLGQIRGGGLMPVAFGGYKPSPLFPDLPLIGTTLPEYRITNWFSMVAPGGLSPELTAYWSKALGTATSNPTFQQRMVENGMEILYGPQEEFKKTIAADRKRWADVIASAGIKAD